MKTLTKLSTFGAVILIAGTNIVAAADLVISNFAPWPDNQNILSLDLDQLADSGSNGYIISTLVINGQQVSGYVMLDCGALETKSSCTLTVSHHLTLILSDRGKLGIVIKVPHLLSS